MAEEKTENKQKRSYEKKERPVKRNYQEGRKTTRTKNQEEGKKTRPYQKRNTNHTKSEKVKIVSTQKGENVETVDEKPVVERKRKTSTRTRRATKNNNMFKASKLKIIPLGGLHEVGKNITVFEYENEMIVVDCGLSFPEDDMLGVDLVIPDIT